MSKPGIEAPYPVNRGIGNLVEVAQAAGMKEVVISQTKIEHARGVIEATHAFGLPVPLSEALVDVYRGLPLYSRDALEQGAELVLRMKGENWDVGMRRRISMLAGKTTTP